MKKDKSQDEEQIQALARAVINQATPGQRIVLLKWAQDIQIIMNGRTPKGNKAVSAIKATSQADVLLPIMKFVGSEIKRLGWDDRSLPARVGLSAAVAALTLSGSSAGIAALGGAIGVPLWVVFGAGGTFVGVIIDELIKSNK